MSQVDALHRLLRAAPPRAAEIVKRFTLRGVGLDALGPLFDVPPAEAKVLLFRALLDVHSGGTAVVDDAREAALVAQVLDGAAPTDPLAQALLELVARLRTHAAPLELELKKAADAFEASPDRVRDEWLRRLAIVVVLALTAWFYWAEQNKPKPPWEKRPGPAQPAK